MVYDILIRKELHLFFHFLLQIQMWRLILTTNTKTLQWQFSVTVKYNVTNRTKFWIPVDTEISTLHYWISTVIGHLWTFNQNLLRTIKMKKKTEGLTTMKRSIIVFWRFSKELLNIYFPLQNSEVYKVIYAYFSYKLGGMVPKILISSTQTNSFQYIPNGVFTFEKTMIWKLSSI